MTYAAPASDFYDDGLVHSHDWSCSTPPGGKPGESRKQAGTHEREDSASMEHRRVRT